MHASVFCSQKQDIPVGLVTGGWEPSDVGDGDRTRIPW